MKCSIGTIDAGELMAITDLLSLEQNLLHWKWYFSKQYLFNPVVNLSIKVGIHFPPPHFCLRPSAKDQGITWVVVLVVVLHHLVHFHYKRNLSEKKSPSLGIEPGSFRSSAKHLSTELQSHRNFLFENWFVYLAADLGPILVDTCLLI